MKSLRINKLRVQRSTQFSLSIPTLHIPQQHILCIAGPNGSGKTTFIETITGLLSPTSGQVLVNDQLMDNNVYTMRSQIGYVPDDEQWFVKELCAREYCDLLMSIYRSAG